MAGVVHSIDELVGHTPLMELDRFERQQHCGAHILAKLEFFNPTGSVKDRAALAMIQAAEQSGALKPGGTIVEQTSGNTGIGLAAFAAARGYRMEIFLERGASLERRLILPAYGVPEEELSEYLTPDWSDEYINVRTAEAYATARDVLHTEGLFLGTSAAAALHAAVQVGQRAEYAGKSIAVILPDNGMKYLSTPMYQQTI